MDKKVRNSYLMFSGLIILLIIIIFKSFNTKNKSAKPEFKPSFKESNSKGDFVDNLDSTTLIYSNYKYGFAMDFPDNWSIDKGVSEHTIIRGYRKDSAISLSINIIELNDVNLKELNIWDLWDNKSIGLEDNYHQMLSKIGSSKTYNYATRKVNISNREGIEISFNYTVKEVDVSYEMQSIFYSMYVSPYTYTFALHVPKIFYDIEPDRYKYMINDFIVMNNE